MKNIVSTTIRIPIDQYKKLKAYATQEDISINQAVRRAIRELLNK